MWEILKFQINWNMKFEEEIQSHRESKSLSAW